MIGFIDILLKVLSSSKNAILSTDYANDEIVKGNAFQVHRIFEIPSGGKKLVLDLTNISDDFTFTLPLRLATNEGQCWVNTYKIDSYTRGDIVPVINRNGTSAHTPNGVFKAGVTSTDVAGDDLRQYIVGTLSTNQNSGGGIGGSSNIKIFGKDIIMFDVENKENSTIYLELNFNWYEI